MLVYSAIDSATIKRIDNILIENNVKANNLISFIDTASIKKIDIIKQFSKNLLIDSGAFTIFNNPSKIKNYNDYVKKYIDFIKKNDDDVVKGYFEFDVGKFIDYEEVKNIRDDLFEVSDKIIPVWHNYLGVNEFKNMCNEYDYIGIGGIASKEIKVEQTIPLMKYGIKNNVKLHMLGMTKQEVLNKYPFYSCDTTRWITARFGKIFLFKNNKSYSKKLNSKYCSENRIKIDYLCYMNFKKFQDYYYNKWKEYDKEHYESQ